MADEGGGYVFVHCFLVMVCNFMYWSVNVVNANVDHVYWKIDSQVFMSTKSNIYIFHPN